MKAYDRILEYTLFEKNQKNFIFIVHTNAIDVIFTTVSSFDNQFRK